ncbi:UNVERIFIED_ORG: phage integrase family protein [Herbaspirillum seropedicae]
MASKLLTIFCKASVAGSKSLSLVDFDMATFSKKSVWYCAVAAEADRSRLKPAGAAKIHGIRRTFACLSADTRELLKQSPAFFTRQTFRLLLREMDLELGEIKTWCPSHKFEAASRWRGFLAKASFNLGDGTPVANTLDGYHTPLKSISPGRVIPLDKRLIQPTFSGDLISTIPHTSPQELREKARKAVRERLDAIAAACISEVQLYLDICTYQEKCLTIDVPSSVREHILGIITGERSVGTHKNTRWYDYDPEWIVAIAIKHIDSSTALAVKEDGTYANLVLPTSRSLSGLLEFNHYNFQSSNQPWFFARHRLPSRLMTAMFILLLERTGWNPGGLGNLTTDGIVRSGGSLSIQGFKGKTDDFTPIYDVSRDDTWVRTVIIMLERNLQYLIEIKLVPTTETRLWFGWQRKGYSEISNHVHQAAIHRFCDKHELPHFAPTELRPLNAAEMYLETQDLKMVQVLLGHGSLTMSQAYLESTLMFHLNEAEALQYQRTIEATLMFASRGQQAFVSMKLEQRFVDTQLLYPTGDGGTCKNPQSPPHQPKPGEMCDGLRCHLNGGCPNYKLQVDVTTLEMAIRTREMYRSRWQMLLQRNEMAFRKLHMPRIIFIHVLLKIVAEKRPKLLDAAITKFASPATP